MKVVKFQFMVVGEYTIPLDESSLEGYGTDDPEEMAKVDEKMLDDDPGTFLSMSTLSETKVVVLEVKEEA